MEGGGRMRMGGEGKSQLVGRSIERDGGGSGRGKEGVYSYIAYSCSGKVDTRGSSWIRVLDDTCSTYSHTMYGSLFSNITPHCIHLSFHCLKTVLRCDLISMW